MELMKPIKGMCRLELSQFFNKGQQKELKALPDVTKMTATELESEFWEIQHRFDARMTMDEAEGDLGVKLIFRQKLLDEFFNKITGQWIVK